MARKFEENNDFDCGRCGVRKSKTNYYQSKSEIFNKTKMIPICKDCIRDIFADLCKKHENPADAILYTCMHVNMPWHEDWINEAMNKPDERYYKRDDEGKYLDADEYKMAIFKTFVKNAQSLGAKNKGIYDFIPPKEFTFGFNEKFCDEEKEKRRKEVTQETIQFFGEGYETKEYLAMQSKYDFLLNNFDEKTNMHVEALKTYVRYRVKEEFATAEGSATDAKKWADMAKDAANAAKINPSQLTAADLSEGLSTLGELSLAVEKAVDIIPILPQFKYRPNDALDFNIWCYVNYERHLRGLPLVEYEDVYKFYDERIEDYVEQYGDPYGIFENDTTIKNRDKIEKFIVIEEGE